MDGLPIPWAWLSLALLGGFHGLNPAMGWLFAVAIGFQERRLRAVLAALGPIAVGHALAIGLVAVPVGLLGLVLPERAMLVVSGAMLIGFASFKVATRFRHPRWVGMRLGSRELVGWSFVMASAHGAGLMLAPVIANMRRPATVLAVGMNDGEPHVMPDGSMMTGADTPTVTTGHHLVGGGDALGPALASVAIHTAAMLVVAAAIAVIVYRKIGVGVLRSAWINLDFIWFGVFFVTGGIAIGIGVWPALGW